MFGVAGRAVRISVTALLLICALLALVAIWDHYLTAPWTRDGQVQVNVVSLAPQVSGQVTALHVIDNQQIHRGDVLYEIEPIDYQIAESVAQATTDGKAADLALRQSETKRRLALTDLSTSREEVQTYQSNAAVAAAAYALSLAQLNQAKIDLQRTKVLSPVNGYATNLQLRIGDYATKGVRNISLIDSDSFYVAGYFEETKLQGIHIGDKAIVALMGYKRPVIGHVESIARGINSPNADPGSLGLASVSPVFTWVRLAQRIPVRIHIDEVPPGLVLSAGMTATITVGPDVAPNAAHGILSRLFYRLQP
jgi:multidrug resistance efflux pump